jgi:hypothetical protein
MDTLEYKDEEAALEAGFYEGGFLPGEGHAGYDVLNLHMGDDNELDPIVIERMTGPKVYLGGLVDKRTGVQYHHSYTETADPRIRAHKWEGVPAGSRIERTVQTTTTATRSAQLARESGAQTKRSDLHSDTSGDRVLVARPYITSEEVLRVRHEQALRIQCAVRQAQARSKANALRDAQDAALDAAEAAAVRAAAAARAAAIRDAARRKNPRTPSDFALLFDELEEWRESEFALINSATEDARRACMAAPMPSTSWELAGALARRKLQLDGVDGNRKRALVTVARREQELVNQIERMRGVAARLNAAEATDRQLASMAGPRTLGPRLVLLPSGETHSIAAVSGLITPFAARAAALKELYDGLDTPSSAPAPSATSTGSPLTLTAATLAAATPVRHHIDPQARADLLLHVKYTVKEFDTALTREIGSLVDREVDMMQRNRPAASLGPLRTRIRSLFRLFCTTPEFNPEAAAFQRVPGGLLGTLGGSMKLTAAAPVGATPTPVGGNPFVGTRRDPRFLSIPSFMRPVH